VVIGTVSIAVGAALVGTFTFLRKQALVGDAIAHSILPGICFAFILSGVKDPLYLIIGAFISGWLSVLLIEWVSSNTKLKPDTAIAFILTFFFGVGAMLLSYIQNSGNAAQSGLDQFLFGKAAAIGKDDIWIFASIGIVLIVMIILFFRTFKLISFNRDFAKSLGMKVKVHEMVLSSLTVLSIASGIQAVGVVLMAALLITPATIARQWTYNLKWMAVLAVVFASISGFFGAYISYTAPAMPTGPWIVVVLSSFAIVSVFVAPKRGIISRILNQIRNRKQIRRENLLKTIYHCCEMDQVDYIKSTRILEQRSFGNVEFERAMRKLQEEGLILKNAGYWSFSENGEKEAKRIVRLHRLWEMYLTQRMNFDDDHIHGAAESIEHIITPEIEKALEKELGFPKLDPHNKQIPY
jgi:manganese/zinc/iron transport system permease protein